ncbi:MAG: lipopolysaccharide biosynthesis protein [bacterium]
MAEPLPEQVAFDLPWMARSSLGFLATNGVLLGLGVAQSILTARLLGPQGKGTLFIALLTTSTIAQLLSFSVGISLQFHVGRGEVKAATAGTLAILFAVVVGGAGALTLSLAPLWAALGFPLERSTQQLTLVMAPLIPAEMLVLSLGALFIATNLVPHRLVIDTAQAALALALVLVLVQGVGRGVRGAVEALLLANLTAAGLLVAVYAKAHGLSLGGLAPALGSVLRFGVRQHGAAVMARALKRIDSYILLYFWGTSAVGIYSVALSLAEIPLIVGRSIQGVLLSFVSRAAPPEGSRTTARITRMLLPALLVIQLLYAGAALWMLPVVFGAAFASASWPFLILLAATLCLSVYVVLSGYLSGSGHPEELTRIMALSLVANIILSLVLVPTLSLSGNALATSLAALLTMVAAVGAFRRIGRIGAREVIVVRATDWVQARRWLGRLTGRGR